MRNGFFRGLPVDLDPCGEPRIDQGGVSRVQGFDRRQRSRMRQHPPLRLRHPTQSACLEAAQREYLHVLLPLAVSEFIRESVIEAGATGEPCGLSTVFRIGLHSGPAFFPSNRPDNWKRQCFRRRCQPCRANRACCHARPGMGQSFICQNVRCYERHGARVR